MQTQQLNIRRLNIRLFSLRIFLPCLALLYEALPGLCGYVPVATVSQLLKDSACYRTSDLQVV